MSEISVSNKKYWLYFLISFIGTVVILMTITEWFWVGLPFVGTFLVKALNRM